MNLGSNYTHEDGVVKSKRTGKAVRVYYRSDGRPYVRIKEKETEHSIDVKNVVFELEYGDLEGLVTNIDGDVMNNHPSNLECLQGVRQFNHCISKKKLKPVKGKDYITMKVTNFNSIGEAAKTMKVNQSSISRAISNGTICKGHYWLKG